MKVDDRPVLRALTLVVGLLTMLLGIAFITVPTMVKMGNEWLIALLILGSAVLCAGFMFTTLRSDVRGYTGLLTLLSLATGLTILINPLDRAITLTVVLAVYFMVESALWGGLGTSLRPHWSITIILYCIALVSFVLSLLIWLRMAGAPKPVIVSLLGINFIARGLGYMAIGFMMKGRERLAPDSGPDASHGATPAPM